MKEQLALDPAHQGDLWFHKNRPRMPRAHRHDELELNIVIEGTAAYLMDTRRINLVPNSLCWLFPEQEHILVDTSPDYEMVCLVFKQALLRQTCTDKITDPLLNRNPAGIFCRRLPQVQLNRLRALCQEVLQARSETNRFNLGLGYLLLSAWSAYQQAHEPALVQRLHPAVSQAVHLILTDRAAETLPALAQQVGISPARLSRLLKSQTGMALTDFRNRHRLKRFLRLYETEPDKTMLELALTVGFGSYAQFHRVFKQLLGVSPRDYRQKIGQTVPAVQT
jgi:AraC-like DNA-binding protein